MPAPPPLSALQRIRRSIRPLLTLVFLGGGGGLLLGLVLFTAHRQGAFERQLQIRLVVPDASGLHPGSRVTLSGVQVGRCGSWMCSAMAGSCCASPCRSATGVW